MFENILAIDVHTWHQPMQDRFLYLYIKIQKKTYKMFKKMFKAWEKSFLH
uniref:Alternative protein ZNRF1 n=1 Tax=Homo sapiens TaxID=9606 RepID=L8E9D1_HUMAN|nr:alternative protein ZNRF1 [Homo sapiens]